MSALITSTRLNGCNPIIRQHGFSLIEFMIASALSLIVLAALTAMFVTSSRARDDLQRANQQIENGRYALQKLSFDLQMAGYYGEFDLGNVDNIDTPADKPDPCSTNLALIDDALSIHIQGYDNTKKDQNNVDLTCLADYKVDTDIIVIRRTSSCANCTAIANAPYFQASNCRNPTELQSTDYHDWYRLAIGQANGSLNRTQKDCTTAAEKRRLITHIYFIANNNEAGDGIPTLKRAELTTVKADGTTGALGFYIKPIVDGIENLQVEYGIDDNSPGDGIPDAYTANPDAHNACAAAACRVANWQNVISAKINILSRSLSRSPGHVDTKVFTLGFGVDDNVVADADTDPDTQCALDNEPDGNCDAFGDNYKRHAMQSQVQINNPSGRP